MVLNSLNFCLSEKLFISPSIVNEILAGYCNLGCRFFPFNTLNISCHSLLAPRVYAERSAVKHMGFPLYVTCCFSLAAFNILSLCLVFVSLISRCLGVFLLGFILYGTLCASWTWLTISFSISGKLEIFNYNLFQNFLILYLFSFWDPYTVNAGDLWQWFPAFCPPGHLSVLLTKLFCYWFLLVDYSSLLVCSSVLVSLW